MSGITRQCTAKRSCGRRCREAVEKGGQHSCGQRCRKPAIRGGIVCMSHGGAAPHVWRSAKQTLREAVDPVAAKLADQALDDTLDESVKLRARTAVLDRAGFGPHSTVSVETRHSTSWVEFLTPEQLSTIGIWIDEAKARMAAGDDPPPPTVTVIEPGSPVDKFRQWVLARKSELATKQQQQVTDAEVTDVAPERATRPVLALVKPNAWANGTPLPEDGSDEQ